jgi:hypothetical protein
MPLARIDWKVSELEQKTFRVTAQLVASEFARLGLQPPCLEDWVLNERGFPQDIRDVAHPTGTTRIGLCYGIAPHNPKIASRRIEFKEDDRYIAGTLRNYFTLSVTDYLFCRGCRHFSWTRNISSSTRRV